MSRGLGEIPEARITAAAAGENHVIPIYRIESGAKANRAGMARYGERYRPEHVPDKSVILTELPKDTEFVHVFRVEPAQRVKDQKVGEWIMPRSEITRPDGSLMSAEEIRQKFSLPRTPTHIVDVRPNRSVKATVSRAAGTSPEAGGVSNHFGKGGGQQWRIQEDLSGDPDAEKWFQDPRPLVD